MYEIVYILLFIIISVSILSLFVLNFIIKFLYRVKDDFLKDILEFVDYIYNNQTKVDYIYKRLKKTENKNCHTD